MLFKESIPAGIANTMKGSAKMEWLEKYVRLSSKTDGLPVLPLIEEDEVQAIAAALERMGIRHGPLFLLRVQITRLMFRYRAEQLYRVLMEHDSSVRDMYDWRLLLEVFVDTYGSECDYNVPLFREMLSSTLGLSWLPSLETLQISLRKVKEKVRIRIRAQEIQCQIEAVSIATIR